MVNVFPGRPIIKTGDLDSNAVTIAKIASLGADPNADRILFWDDSAGALKFLTPGTGLSISGTTINGTSAKELHVGYVSGVNGSGNSTSFADVTGSSGSLTGLDAAKTYDVYGIFIGRGNGNITSNTKLEVEIWLDGANRLTASCSNGDGGVSPIAIAGIGQKASFTGATSIAYKLMFRATTANTVTLASGEYLIVAKEV